MNVIHIKMQTAALGVLYNFSPLFLTPFEVERFDGAALVLYSPNEKCVSSRMMNRSLHFGCFFAAW
jgi:hypothetical protein